MWFANLLKGLGDLVAGLGQGVFRFYAEVEMGGARRLFFLSPVLNNDLDTDNTGTADLRIRIVPHVSVPPDGLTVRFQRLGSGVPGLAVKVYIGIDGGVFPVGTPPPSMQFAFVGFDQPANSPPPQELAVDLSQDTRGGNSRLALEVSPTNAPGPALRLRAGMLTGPPAVEPADRIPGTGTMIRTANPAAATQLTDAHLDLGLPSAGTLTLTPPLTIYVESGPATTAVHYTAPVALSMTADVEDRGTGYTRLIATSPAFPRRLDLSIGATDATVETDSTLSLDVRASGLPLPEPFHHATAHLTLPPTPMHMAWGPPPLLVDISPTTGSSDQLSLALNAQLLGGIRNAQQLPPPPAPRQALVCEYDDSGDLWLAINTLGGLRLTRQNTPSTTTASITLAAPVPGTPPAVPPRSIRLSARTAGRLTADLRASRIDADTTHQDRGTLSATIDLTDSSVTGSLSGRLRHLRALYDDGSARTEAWTVATPSKLGFKCTYPDAVDFTVSPHSAMAIHADRVAYAGGALGPFARIIGRVLVNAPLRGHYANTPRQPLVQGTAATGSTQSRHVDSTGAAFPPELVGMSLRYDSGANRGTSRAITAVATGEITSEPFPAGPTTGDKFTVVSTDLSFEAQDSLPKPSTRRGLSATLSAAAARDRRLATRIHPQVVRQMTVPWVPLAQAVGPGELAAAAGRVEGILRVQLPPPVAPGQGALALDVDLDPARPRRSLRYAEDRRWTFPASVLAALGTTAPSALRPQPRLRALLADAPDTVVLRSTAGIGSNTYTMARTGGTGQGWVWVLTEQRRWQGEFAGIGVVSLDLTELPARTGLVLMSNLPDVRRRTPPGDVMWTPGSGWLPPGSQTVTASGGDLRIDRVVYASFWPGRTARTDGTAQSYPKQDQDEWDLTTASLVHLHDTGAADQRITLWSLDGSDWDDPNRNAGIAIEAIGLNADLDLDRYWALLSPGIRHLSTISWTRTAEIQLQGYTGAWALSGGSSPDYERPNEDVGFWFLRAVNKISGIGDAYLGNTSGNINGRQRLYP